MRYAANFPLFIEYANCLRTLIIVSDKIGWTSSESQAQKWETALAIYLSNENKEGTAACKSVQKDRFKALIGLRKSLNKVFC